jgi:hypothetical protein
MFCEHPIHGSPLASHRTLNFPRRGFGRSRLDGHFQRLGYIFVLQMLSATPRAKTPPETELEKRCTPGPWVYPIYKRSLMPDRSNTENDPDSGARGAPNGQPEACSAPFHPPPSALCGRGERGRTGQQEHPKVALQN